MLIEFIMLRMPAVLYGTPSLAGVSANVASGVAMTRSQVIASSQAPPQTLPSIMAMTGRGIVSMVRTTRRSGSS